MWVVCGVSFIFNDASFSVTIIVAASAASWFRFATDWSFSLSDLAMLLLLLLVLPISFWLLGFLLFFLGAIFGTGLGRIRLGLKIRRTDTRFVVCWGSQLWVGSIYIPVITERRAVLESFRPPGSGATGAQVWQAWPVQREVRRRYGTRTAQPNVRYDQTFHLLSLNLSLNLILIDYFECFYIFCT